MSETIATTKNVNWLNDSGELEAAATWKQVEDGPFITTSARVIANNMSEAYNQYGEDLDKEEKSRRALEQMQKFHESINVPIDDVFVMKPQIDYREPLQVVYVDDVFKPGRGGERAAVSENRGDLTVTFNERTALECRPADCPVLSIHAKLEDGTPLWAQLHVGWNGLKSNYMNDAFATFTELGVKMDTVRIQMSGAGYADSFHYKNAENPHDDSSVELDKDGNPKAKKFTGDKRDILFVNSVKTDDMNSQGQELYSFDMDMPGRIRSDLADFGITPYQLFEEGSDTTHTKSGYSSHRRDGHDKTINTRDVVILRGKSPEQEISAQRAEAMLAKRALQGSETNQT